ncbi:MAG TPA: hypothetical protein VM686_10140, partial [Polyangiaceae bacterium]|nr:hypothetical protein [Polyangiaceae bacterium]
MQATHPPGGDDRGAISLIAVFFAVFAIAMLYSLIGTAQAIAFREGLQDHADKAALSSAILHARSMNLIVLINLVMAGLLAILVALKLVEGLAILGIIVAAGLAWITGGSTLAAIPPLKSVRDSVSSLYDSTKDPVYEALTALHDMASTVRDVAPMVAAAAALSNEDANGLHGFAASTRTTEGLPVVDDSFDYLCAKSGGIIDDLWTAPLTNAGVPIDTLGLGDVVEGMTGTLSEWFCGDSSGGPPSYPHTRTKGYPSTADDEECQASEAVSGEGEAAVSDACTRASRYQAAADPDGTTGACRTGEDCSVTGPYETNAARAREQCSPEGTPRPSQYVYQQRHGTVDYEWDGEAWRLLDRRYDTPRLMGTKKHGLPLPCGPKELNPRVAVGYNKIVRQSSDVSELIPVCSTESLPLTLPGHTPRKGDRMTVEFEEVTHILGCVVQIKESVELG